MADKLAVIQSTETIAELEKIDNKVQSLVGSFKELLVTSEEINRGLTKGTPQEFVDSMVRLNKLIDEYEERSKVVKGTMSEIERLHVKIAKASSDEGKEVAKLRLNLQDLNKENKEHAKTTQQVTSAYDQLNREHEVARKKALDLGVSLGITSKEFLEAAAEANAYDQKLKLVEGTLGKFNRNVGNYQGNMFGLSAQMQQVMREMPNFAMSAQIGIMSLTNNLPYLADAIADINSKSKTLKAEFKEAAILAKEKAIADAIATGESKAAANALGKQAEAQVMANYAAAKGPSIWKQLASSLFSWQTLLIIGITLMTLYGKELIDFVKISVNAGKSIDYLKENVKLLSNAHKEAAKSAATEIVQIDIMINKARNEALSRKERLDAAVALQKTFPTTFGQLSAEQIMVGNVAATYIKLKNAIYQAAYAKAAQSELDKRAEESFQKDQDSRNKLIELYKKLRQKDLSYNEKGTGSLEDGAGITISDAEARKKVEEEINEILKDRFTRKVGEAKANKNILDIISKQKTLEEIKVTNPEKTKTQTVKSPKVAVAKEKDDLEKINKERYNILKEGYENEYKLQEQDLKNKLKLAAENPYLTNVEKVAEQSKVYDDLIKSTNDSYTKLIKAAKQYKQDIQSLEGDRDLKVNGLQDDRDANNMKMPKAIEDDINATSELYRLNQNLTFEEQKQLILKNSKLSATDKELALFNLEKNNQIKLNELEIERLNTIKQQLLAKMLILSSSGSVLSPEEEKQLKEIEATIKKLENSNIEIKFDIEKSNLENILSGLEPAIEMFKQGLQDLGLDNFVGKFDKAFGEISKLFDKNNTETVNWTEVKKAAFALVADLANNYVQAQLESELAALEQEKINSQERTDQEIGFINQRLEMLNSLQNATKEQIDERNALEDEARVLKEQQLEREKMIEVKKAKAQQKAAAQQALINGLLAGTMTIAQMGFVAGAIPAALAVAMGIAMAGLIMAKDPTPKYFVGRKGGKSEWAWTQEKGREIITDKNDNIKSIGSDGGAKMTWLEDGDNVYTASETEKILQDLGSTPKLGDALFRRISKQNISPLLIKSDNIDYDKLADKVGNRFEKTFSKFDKVHYYEDENGDMYKQKGGQYPEFVGKKKVRKTQTEIKIKSNERD